MCAFVRVRGRSRGVSPFSQEPVKSVKSFVVLARDQRYRSNPADSDFTTPCEPPVKPVKSVNQLRRKQPSVVTLNHAPVRNEFLDRVLRVGRGHAVVGDSLDEHGSRNAVVLVLSVLRENP